MCMVAERQELADHIWGQYTVIVTASWIYHCNWKYDWKIKHVEQSVQSFLLSEEGECLGSAGGGVELTKVVLGRFVSVELLLYVLLSGKHTYTKKECMTPTKKRFPFWIWAIFRVLEHLHLKHTVPTLPSALLPAACYDGLSESSGFSSVLRLSSVPHLPL